MRKIDLPRNFSEENYSKSMDELNTLFQGNISLGANLSGQIIEFTVPNGVEIKVKHRLKTVPKYRIILRQRGNGVLLDGTDSPWSSDSVSLKVDGASGDTTFTILLMRG